jgi:hypothetical protein
LLRVIAFGGFNRFTEGIAGHCPEESRGVFRDQVVGKFQPVSFFAFQDEKAFYCRIKIVFDLCGQQGHAGKQGGSGYEQVKSTFHVNASCIEILCLPDAKYSNLLLLYMFFVLIK